MFVSASFRAPEVGLLISILPGRHPFCLLLCQPKGLVSSKTSPCVCYSRDWRSCTFSFLTLWPRPKVLQCPTLTSMSSLTVPSFEYFVDGDRDELLLCPIRALWKYLSWMEQYRLEFKGLFIATGMRKKRFFAPPFLSGCSRSSTQVRAHRQ